MTSPPLDTTDLLWRAHAHGIRHGAINFWAGTLSCLLDSITASTKVLEYGSTGSEFLRLLHLAFEYREATGVMLDVDGPDRSADWAHPAGPPCRFVRESTDIPAGSADVAFTQETFSLIPDLPRHAQTMHETLSPKGVYYATFGWHLDNPATGGYLAARESAGQPFHGYRLSDVASAFSGAGFEVGFKRLPVPYFLMHNPAIVGSRFGGVPEMINALHDWKILFQFRKTGPR